MNTHVSDSIIRFLHNLWIILLTLSGLRVRKKTFKHTHKMIYDKLRFHTSEVLKKSLLLSKESEESSYKCIDAHDLFSFAMQVNIITMWSIISKVAIFILSTVTNI